MCPKTLTGKIWAVICTTIVNNNWIQRSLFTQVYCYYCFFELWHEWSLLVEWITDMHGCPSLCNSVIALTISMVLISFLLKKLIKLTNLHHCSKRHLMSESKTIPDRDVFFYKKTNKKIMTMRFGMQGMDPCAFCIMCYLSYTPLIKNR